MKSNTKESLNFLMKGKVELIAPKLLGKKLFTNIGGVVCSGKIVEVEAYCGKRDRACHAFFGQTERNKIMFSSGGKAYVYLCYGLHHLFNIVVGPENDPSAVLIRAIEPLDGIEEMLSRRKISSLSPKLTNGPGKMSQALGLNMAYYGEALNGSRVWLEKGERVAKKNILTGPRIGIDYAGEDKHLPWRFALNSSYVSSPKKSLA